MIINILSSFYSFLSNVIVILYFSSFCFCWYSIRSLAGRSERKSAGSFYSGRGSQKYADSICFLRDVGFTVFVQRPVRSRRTGFCSLIESISPFIDWINGSFSDWFPILFIPRVRKPSGTGSLCDSDTFCSIGPVFIQISERIFKKDFRFKITFPLTRSHKVLGTQKSVFLWMYFSTRVRGFKVSASLSQKRAPRLYPFPIPPWRANSVWVWGRRVSLQSDSAHLLVRSMYYTGSMYFLFCL